MLLVRVSLVLVLGCAAVLADPADEEIWRSRRHANLAPSSVRNRQPFVFPENVASLSGVPFWQMRHDGGPLGTEQHNQVSSRVDKGRVNQGQVKGSPMLAFEALGHLFRIKVQPYHGLFDSVKTAEKSGLDSSSYFQGTLLNAKAFAGFSAEQGQALAHFRVERNGDVRGLVHIPGNDTFVLEASAHHFSDEQRRDEMMGHVLAFNHAAVEDRHAQLGYPDSSCGVHHGTSSSSVNADGDAADSSAVSSESAALPVTGHHSVRARAARESRSRRQVDRTCTIALVGDSFFHDYMGNEYESVREMVDILAGVNTIYRTQNLPGFQVVSTRVYTMAASDPFRAVAADADQLLAELANQAPNIEPAVKCAVHAFTYNRYNGVVGKAQVGVACATNGAPGITSHLSFTPQALSQTIIVAAHELGHNFDAAHDPEGPAGSAKDIMAASGASVGTGRFSTQSVNTINSFADTVNCLTTSPTPNSVGFCGNGRVETERGETCDCGSSTCSDPTCDGSTCTTTGLAAGQQCSPSGNPCCDGTTNMFRTDGTTCGGSPYQLNWVAGPVCNGTHGSCPDCWPSDKGHPCWRASNLVPCDGGFPCEAFCDDGSGCRSARRWNNIDTFLPAGVCCDACPSGRCTCSASGSCGSCSPPDCGFAECGTAEDGCGNSYSCGSCPSGFVCLQAVCGPDPEALGDKSDAKNAWQSLGLLIQLIIIIGAVVFFICCLISCFGGNEQRKKRKNNKGGYY